MFSALISALSFSPKCTTPLEMASAIGRLTSSPSPSLNFNLYFLLPLVVNSIVSTSTSDKPLYSISQLLVNITSGSANSGFSLNLPPTGTKKSSSAVMFICILFILNVALSSVPSIMTDASSIVSSSTLRLLLESTSVIEVSFSSTF